MSETDLVRAAVQYLELRGVFCWRQNVGSMVIKNEGKQRFVRFAVKGVSDIIGCLPGGRFLAAEAKIGKNKPTRDQRAFLDEVEAAGGLAVVFYSLDELAEAIGKAAGEPAKEKTDA